MRLPAGVASIASIVVIFLPTADEAGVRHERVGRPSTWIVQAPHNPAPHPNFVPVNFKTSRSVHSSGISCGMSTLRSLPLTLSVIIRLLPCKKTVSWTSALPSPSGRRRPIDIDHRLGKGLRRLLREVVADATPDVAMRVLAGKLLGVRARLRVRRAVRVSLERDRRN